MNKKVVIAGATGLIGKILISKLIERGDDVTILTRSVERARRLIPDISKYVYWDFSSKDWYYELSGKDAVINLAGEGVMAGRWTKERKNNILKSRIDSTKFLIEAISVVKEKPEVFISASAIGYYGNTQNEVDESSAKGNGFLSHVVDDWENESKKVDQLNIRRVNVRIGIVLDKNEGALAKMILPFKYFAGGPLGNGQQWMPWIHVDDLANVFLFAVDNCNIKGIVNGVAPNPVKMNEFAKSLGKVMKRPAFFRVPEFVLKIILGEAASVVLEGAKVIPKKLEEHKFPFEYLDLEKAIKNLLD